MNNAIDFLMVTGRWEKMAEPYVRRALLRQAATRGLVARLARRSVIRPWLLTGPSKLRGRCWENG